MCLTRPDITEIVWPTEAEMVEMKAAHAEAAEVERERLKRATDQMQKGGKVK
jgi:hypothetical protein